MRVGVGGLPPFPLCSSSFLLSHFSSFLPCGWPATPLRSPPLWLTAPPGLSPPPSPLQALRDSLKFLKAWSRETSGGALDILRIEALSTLPAAIRPRVLQRDYDVIIPIAPLQVGPRLALTAGRGPRSS